MASCQLEERELSKNKSSEEGWRGEGREEDEGDWKRYIGDDD